MQKYNAPPLVRVSTLHTMFMVCFAVIFSFSDAMANENPSDKTAKKHNGRQASIFLENDVFSSALRLGKSDKWYTNGIKLVYSYDEENHMPQTKMMQDAVGSLASHLLDDGRRHGVVIGQLMYTPNNIAAATPQPNDRFYGGWLYFGGVVQKNSANQTRTAELVIGMVGRYSFAEQAQKFIHRSFGYTTPAGWDYQIRSEPGVQFSYNNIVKFKSASYADASYYLGGVAGTVFDNLKGGFILRLGDNLEKVPVSVIESPVLGAKLKDHGWYLLLRGEIQGVLHNTFIDGSLFRADPFQSNIKSKPIIGQLTGGIIKEGVFGVPIKFSFLVNRKTPEFTSPTLGRGPLFTYGTVNIEFPL